MPGGKGNIKPSDRTNGFDKNPQNINKKGRPRKLISETINELKESGVAETTTAEIKAVYLMLVNLTIPELEERVKDSKQSALVRIVGKAILSGKGFEIIEKMLDRTLGKPQQEIKHDISEVKPLQFKVYKND
jgi:hypothetical protein